MRRLRSAVLFLGVVAFAACSSVPAAATPPTKSLGQEICADLANAHEAAGHLSSLQKALAANDTGLAANEVIAASAVMSLGSVQWTELTQELIGRIEHLIVQWNYLDTSVRAGTPDAAERLSQVVASQDLLDEEVARLATLGYGCP
jgi:hypothetical protein